jgi:hypothetical protein
MGEKSAAEVVGGLGRRVALVVFSSARLLAKARISKQLLKRRLQCAENRWLTAQKRLRRVAEVIAGLESYRKATGDEAFQPIAADLRKAIR